MYNYLWLFLIFSFLGWCLEVGFHAVKTGAFVNRGFLSGPVCPIYGVGTVFAYMLFSSISHTWIPLFFACAFTCTAVELVVGFMMDKIFKNKWWDYSGEKFNLAGYICPKFFFIWGILCTLAVKTFDPLLSLVDLINPYVSYVVFGVWYSVFAIDWLTSVILVVKMNAHLKKLNEFAKIISGKMAIGSEFVGEGVARGTVAVQKEYDKLLLKSAKLSSRIIKAFPTMSSFKYNEQLKKMREKISSFKRKKGEVEKPSSDKKDDL